MASLPWVWKSVFQLLGAIGIVLAVKMDRESMWAFVIPTAFAGLVLVTSWVSHRLIGQKALSERIAAHEKNAIFHVVGCHKQFLRISSD